VHLTSFREGHIWKCQTGKKLAAGMTLPYVGKDVAGGKSSRRAESQKLQLQKKRTSSSSEEKAPRSSG